MVLQRLFGRPEPTRAERIRFEGSPPVRARLGILTTLAIAAVDLRAGASGKYAPYNFLEITNNSDEELALRVSGQTFTILSRQTKQFEDLYFWNFTIQNVSTTSTSADEIEYIAQRKPTDTDQETRERAGGRF